MSEQQHYVPQFLLRRFTSGTKPAIWAFDKTDGRAFRTNIHNVAGERGFYEMQIGDELISLESHLGQLESQVAKTIDALIQTRNLTSVDPEARRTLAMFIAVQFVRTKEHRLRFENLTQDIFDKLKEDGNSEYQLYKLFGEDIFTNDSKFHGLSSVLDAVDYASHFLNKIWCIFEAPEDQPFYISDNPIALHNQIDAGPYGNLGLAVTGIEIYFPLSPFITLAMFCPTLAASISSQADQIKRLEIEQLGIPDSAVPMAQHLKALSQGIQRGVAVPISTAMVQMMNSLQVAFSSRYVFSQIDDFAVARTILATNPAYAAGVKSSVR